MDPCSINFRLLHDKTKIRLLNVKHRAKGLGIFLFFKSNVMTFLRGNQVTSMFDLEYSSLQEYLPLEEVILPFDLNIEEDDMDA